MGIPSGDDHRLSKIDDAHQTIMTRCRVYRYAGRDRDPRAIREALQDYLDAAVKFINEAE